MAILFNKAQSGIIPPVEGQVSPSGRSKYTNGQWVGIPIVDYDPKITNEFDASGMMPSGMLEGYGFAKKSKDPVTVSLLNAPKQKSIYSTKIQSNVDFRMGGGPKINGVEQSDTLYPAGGRYQVDATGDRNNRLLVKMPTGDKGNIAWASRFISKK